MNEQEFGKCDCCGKEFTLVRKYYYYNIECDCCVGVRHFQCVKHCSKCIPKPPMVRIALDIQPDSEN